MTTDAPHPSADLTDAEVLFICRPLKQRAAQVRYLRDKLHLHVDVAPDGRPLVNRAHYNEVRSGRALSAGEADSKGPAANEDDTVSDFAAWAAKRAAAKRRDRRHG